MAVGSYKMESSVSKHFLMLKTGPLTIQLHPLKSVYKCSLMKGKGGGLVCGCTVLRTWFPKHQTSFTCIMLKPSI